ncbi:3'(2'),5'-bisphosphate nucleotidase CysQ [Micromonospora sp. WMMD1128]|uniref:3'(2'),5'-bisphosphate nucleotidase CysQ n=1 Tax=unclassified Micromonospora TaxID=2617518 RepID=UPI00248CA54B|nr:MULTISPECIES: 3'(2'),5'-bisphosphate nucleotidase CysQ [unclassified Micromonospora]WBB73818.1 3'(2'),5'-bisphosphate nucleotidase CysQ [Micromonospora sp. WMMD1128]WFE32777.1 3'(2'),5'-bisphosphate nucleotidase CysQ [Micromonospora sp. WMMD975]
MGLVTEDETGRLDDQRFAQWLAAEAGVALTALRDRQGFADPKALKDAGDRASHELMTAALARWRPADAVLSEEEADARRAWADGERAPRHEADRVWIIDPLDGTREFSEAGRDDWAVHVALWQRSAAPDGALVAGAVGMPARTTVDGTPVVLGTTCPTPKATEGPIRIAVSRSRPPAFVGELVEMLGARAVPMGSAGVKVCAVVTGEVDAYVHAGGQYEWDSAAPVAVALGAGMHASRIDGSPLRYNRADPRLPDLLVCRPELADRLLDAIARTGVEMPASAVTGDRGEAFG